MGVLDELLVKDIHETERGCGKRFFGSVTFTLEMRRLVDFMGTIKIASEKRTGKKST